MVMVSEVPELMKGFPGLSSSTLETAEDEFIEPVPADVEVIFDN